MDDGWLRRLDCERRVKNIPGDQARVLQALWRLVTLGNDCPSEAALAAEAGVSRRTVQRAKATGRELGLLAWDRQWAVEGGLRREQPCAYRVEQPAAPVVRRERQSGARTGRTITARSIEQQLAAVPAVTPELQAMWVARRARIFGSNRSATPA